MKKILVLLTAVALVAAFTLPAMAKEGGPVWSFYGHSRFQTFWVDDNKEAGDDEGLDWYHQTNSRIGANVSAGPISGRWETGFDPDGDGITGRILWGEWDFGAGKLGIGRNYVPYNRFVSSQAFEDAGLIGYGAYYGGREEMIRLRFGDFDVALVHNAAPDLDGFAVADTDVTIPRIDARYLFTMGAVQVEVNGTYQTYEVEDAAGNTEDVDSWGVALGYALNFGPLGIEGNVAYGENVGNIQGIVNGTDDEAFWNGRSVVDNETLNLALVVYFKLSDMVRLEAGYGWSASELDQKGSKEDDISSYYLQAKFTLAKNVFLTPEIGMIDHGDDSAGNDEGETTYFGAKWEIRF
jgi:hypothetical protein